MNSTGPPKRKRRRQAPFPKLTQPNLLKEWPSCQRPCFIETPLGRWLNRQRRLARLEREIALKENAGRAK
jgi:hypothetical protein